MKTTEADAPSAAQLEVLRIALSHRIYVGRPRWFWIQWGVLGISDETVASCVRDAYLSEKWVRHPHALNGRLQEWRLTVHGARALDVTIYTGPELSKEPSPLPAWLEGVIPYIGPIMLSIFAKLLLSFGDDELALGRVGPAFATASVGLVMYLAAAIRILTLMYRWVQRGPR